MIVAVIGLGLIGGSIAKAIKQGTKHTVYGFDINDSVMRKAKLLGAMDFELTDEKLKLCDFVIIATYPQICVNYVKQKAELFNKNCIVMDCCGVKSSVCAEIFPLAQSKGFTFIGGHPMAGREYSGFDNSRKNLFNDASLILTPPANTKEEIIEKIKDFWRILGFSNFEVTTCEKHDQIIAYTSQLAHVASSAYIKSPSAKVHAGFSAGSYKDLTRVARLNENMWTELFLQNASFLEKELDIYIKHLTEYSNALKNRNEEELKRLLKEGRECKENADKGEDLI